MNKQLHPLAARIGTFEAFEAASVEEIAGQTLAWWNARCRGADWSEGEFVRFFLPDSFAQPGMAALTEDSSLKRWVELKLREVWRWLEGQALIVPKDSINTTKMILGTRARTFEHQDTFLTWLETRLLSRETLSEKMPACVWSAFAQRHFDTAVFEAFKSVETRLKTLHGARGGDPDRGKHAKEVINDLFKPPTRDRSHMSLVDISGHQEGLHQLFLGATAYFRNPVAHNEIGHDDPVKVARIISFADLLHRTLDDLLDASNSNRQRRGVDDH